MEIEDPEGATGIQIDRGDVVLIPVKIEFFEEKGGNGNSKTMSLAANSMGFYKPTGIVFKSWKITRGDEFPGPV